jgi:hypothetical protein
MATDQRRRQPMTRSEISGHSWHGHSIAYFWMSTRDDLDDGLGSARPTSPRDQRGDAYGSEYS